VGDTDESRKMSIGRTRRVGDEEAKVLWLCGPVASLLVAMRFALADTRQICEMSDAPSIENDPPRWDVDLLRGGPKDTTGGWGWPMGMANGDGQRGGQLAAVRAACNLYDLQSLRRGYGHARSCSRLVQTISSSIQSTALCAGASQVP
jgi:hypothetical protein